MAWQGRYLVIGFASGEIPKIPLNLVLLKGCDVQGAFWGSFATASPPHHAANMAWLLAHVADGVAGRRASSAVFPLDRDAGGARRPARREAKGKVLVRPGAAALIAQRLPGLPLMALVDRARPPARSPP